MKKIILFVVSFFIAILSLGEVEAKSKNGDEIRNQKKTELKYKGLESNMKLVDSDRHFDVYEVTENGVIFTLKIDKEHGGYLLDDRFVEEMLFEELVEYQVELCNDESFINGSPEYSLKNILSQIPQLRCTTCYINPMYPPTSGYGKLYYRGTGNRRLEVYTTAAAYAIGAKALGVSIPVAASVFKVMKSLNGGGSSYLYYKLYQAYHLKCRTAVYEKRVYYYDSKFTSATGTHGKFYFHSSKPF